MRQLCLIAASSAIAGCGAATAPAPPHANASVPGLAWLSPVDAAEGVTLARWRGAVGSPIVSPHPTGHRRNQGSDALTVVSWNVALDEGDVTGLVAQLRAEHPDRPFVLLLQEVFRSGDDVPRSPLDAAFASHLGGCEIEREVDDLARRLGLSLYYVPSMRNGLSAGEAEDRGNAVLASVPLEDPAAFELPFERQRRVAVSARVSGTTTTGRPWSLQLVNVHLDNLAGGAFGWLSAEAGRARQARGLVDALPAQGPLLVAGDFNTWFGFSDRVYRETAEAFPQTRAGDPRRTFRGLLRLDHVFYRLEEGWQAETRRAESSFGSDHYPLITTVRF